MTDQHQPKPPDDFEVIDELVVQARIRLHNLRQWRYKSPLPRSPREAEAKPAVPAPGDQGRQ